MSKSSKTNKDIKEEKKQVKKIKKEKKDYLLLRKKAITIGIICLSIVVIELIVMLIMHLVRESKITYIDALYHIENVDNSYIAAGSSNFKHSRYNNTFLYEYTSEEDKNNVQKIYKSTDVLKLMELGGTVTKGTPSLLLQMKMTILRELFFSNTLFQRILIILTATLRLMLENGML